MPMKRKMPGSKNDFFEKSENSSKLSQKNEIFNLKKLETYTPEKYLIYRSQSEKLPKNKSLVLTLLDCSKLGIELML